MFPGRYRLQFKMFFLVILSNYAYLHDLRYNCTMSHHLLFICGGAWSGKSDQALAHAHDAKNVAWIGTAAPTFPDLNKQIEYLKASRPRHWKTIDAPFSLPEAISNAHQKNPDSLLVIDSVSQWLGNEIAKLAPRYDESQLFDCLSREIEELSATLTACLASQSLIVVSSDFGQSPPPQDPMIRTLRMTVGLANKMIAAISHKAEFMMAGIVISTKVKT